LNGYVQYTEYTAGIFFLHSGWKVASIVATGCDNAVKLLSVSRLITTLLQAIWHGSMYQMGSDVHDNFIDQPLIIFFQLPALI